MNSFIKELPGKYLIFNIYIFPLFVSDTIEGLATYRLNSKS